MSLILVLAPISLFIALIWLAAFWWTLKSGQYDDPLGDAARILDDHLEDGPGR
jgi:cbb3-type cytochrome oxidase maturation protein